MVSGSQTRRNRIGELIRDLGTRDPVYENIMGLARNKWPELSYATLDDYVRSVLDRVRMKLEEDKK